MAPSKVKKSTVSVTRLLKHEKVRKKRPGIVSKKKNSKLKSSKNYKKRYCGQGR